MPCHKKKGGPMKKILALFLCMVLLLGSIPALAEEAYTGPSTAFPEALTEEELSGLGLEDPALLSALETQIYFEANEALEGTGYVLTDISSAYVSKEYLEELEYNSRANIYFGYTLEELDQEFQGEKYVFTLNEEGDTAVVPFEDYDDTYDQVIRNVLVGSGVILFSVTISAATGGAAPAVSLILSASAKSGTIMALSSGAISAAIAGAVTGLQTQDLSASLKAAALQGSQGFKMGAIVGAASGAAGQMIALHTASAGGLSWNEVAGILKEHKLPSAFLKQIKSMEQFDALVQNAEAAGLSIEEVSSMYMATKYPLEVVTLFKSTEESAIYYNQANLSPATIAGRNALIRNIDLTYESELAGKMVTNLERMSKGYAAIDPQTGLAYELHHIGQHLDSPLAILTKAEHILGGNDKILHQATEGVHSLLSNAQWAAERREFWQGLAALLS